MVQPSLLTTLALVGRARVRACPVIDTGVWVVSEKYVRIKRRSAFTRALKFRLLIIT